MRYMLFLDYDLQDRRSGNWGWLFYLPKWWVDFRFSDFLELILMDVKRLQRMFRLGKAVVYRSSQNGVHVYFPDARLTKEQVEAILLESKCHWGFKQFSVRVGDQTLRVSGKKGAGRPELICILLQL